jgi:hypothetical protein
MTDGISDAYSSHGTVVHEMSQGLCQGVVRREGQQYWWQCHSCNLETGQRARSVEGALTDSLFGFEPHAIQVEARMQARLASVGKQIVEASE